MSSVRIGSVNGAALPIVAVRKVGLTTSADEFANTYDHEKGHLVRHISQHLGLEPYGEQEQYIAGYVSQQMFSVAKSFLCEHCRHNNNALANFIRVFL